MTPEFSSDFDIKRFNIQPLQVLCHLDRYVVGQDMAKAVLAEAVCSHYARLKVRELQGQEYDSSIVREKPNVLLVGPSGCGKSTLLRLAAQAIGVPCTIEDLTGYTEAGYIGDDIDNIPRNLLHASDGNLSLAQMGIIGLDEVDKIACSEGYGRDVSGQGVQEGLLRLIEGKTLQAYPSRRHKGPDASSLNISTEDMLFIFAGAFEGFEGEIETVKGKVGFASENPFTSSKAANPLRKRIQGYGLIPQLTGRIPNVVELDALGPEELYAILKMPTCSSVITRIEEFRGLGNGIELYFEESSFEALAEGLALQNEGARYLSSVLSDLLRKAKMTLPSTDCRKLRITREFVQDPEGSLRKLLECFPLKEIIPLEVRKPSVTIVYNKSGGSVPDTIEEYKTELIALEIEERYLAVAARYGMEADLPPSDLPEILTVVAEEVAEAFESMSEHYGILFDIDEDLKEHLELLALERVGIDVQIMLQENIGRYIQDDEQFLQMYGGTEEVVQLNENALYQPVQFFASCRERVQK